MYVDDILLTGSDSAGIVKTKEYLRRHFVTKDIDKPKYFLGIEVAYQKQCTSTEVYSESFGGDGTFGGANQPVL